MSSGVRARCNSCGVRIENPLAGSKFSEWDAEMVKLGWIVDRVPVGHFTVSVKHYCPTCVAPFAMMLAVLGAGEAASGSPPPPPSRRQP